MDIRIHKVTSLDLTGLTATEGRVIREALQAYAAASSEWANGCAFDGPAKQGYKDDAMTASRLRGQVAEALVTIYGNTKTDEAGQ